VVGCDAFRGIPFNAADSGIAMGVAESIGVDFLGAGNCLGLEVRKAKAIGSTNASTMARTEVLEVRSRQLAADPLAAQIVAAFSGFSSADDKCRRRSKVGLIIECSVLPKKRSPRASSTAQISW